MPEPNNEPVRKVVVVQTPLGILQIALPDMPETDGADPLKIAMDEFQSAVDSGTPDPLQTTLLKLKGMADDGFTQPLTVGLAILKQMADNGMLPPMDELVEGTGINPDNIPTQPAPKTQPGLFDKIDKENLN